MFLAAEGARPWAVLLCLLLSGFTEVVGIAALLPTIQSISNQGLESGGSSPAVIFIHNFMATLGVTPNLSNLILLVLVFFTLKTILLFIALSYAGYTVARVSTGLRRRLIKALFGARWSFYTQLPAGRVANVMSGDATMAGTAYFVAAQTMAFAIQGVIYTIAAFLIDWRVAIVGLIVGAAIAGSLGRLVTITKKAGYERGGRTSDLTGFVTDLMSNIKPLKTMHRYDSLVGEMGLLLRHLRKALVIRELARQGALSGRRPAHYLDPRHRCLSRGDRLEHLAGGACRSRCRLLPGDYHHQQAAEDGADGGGT
ncbi:ABC transporter ATP-binding protein [Nordella sp. HKS 07]|uniref:ABC transporter ATP-binding protein n=1 Tax=Nordella sp. HKS 07 TaxID=2712222 RepID=UPI0013E14CDA|nr:ABC transporter ATP-binding protein [Nordella sp. HKS 07]QIG48830.1 ABC transporter ATP-binding protein [Nordella sp. HKS 07]